MKAIVLINVATEADIANGTRMTIEDNSLDPIEPEPKMEADGTVRLQYPPNVMFFQPDKLATGMADKFKDGRTCTAK